MGIVHHSTYFVWFEIGRVELMHAVGGQSFVSKNEFQYPVIDIQCTYKASARFGQTVIVETILKVPTKAMLEFEYRILRKFGRELLAEGRSVHMLMNAAGQIVYQLPPAIKEGILEYHGGALCKE